jgi:hypothetical protein
MTNENMISVIDAARELGRRKATIFKIMKRLGIEGRKRRNSSKGNQLSSYITQDEYRYICTELSSPDSGIKLVENDLQENGFISAEQGVFYLIQLEPEHDPQRFKVGFAANMMDRLRSLRCSAPFAAVLKTWPCRRLWEKTAIDCVTNKCKQVHTDVFRSDSIQDVIIRCDRFFGMMPLLNDSKQEELRT